MSRLKHPIRSLKEPFGKAGLTVAVVALVFALIGGAYAAGGFTKAQEKQITKIAKKYAGKPGAIGPAGAAGTNGTNGATGKNGTNGKDGTDGADGSPWTVGGTLPSGQTETGTWGFAGTAATITIATHVAFAPISFPIPLATALPETNVFVIKAGENGAGGGTCPTTSSFAKPQAEPGNLCVFESEGSGNVEEVTAFNPEITGEIGAGTTGAVLTIQPVTAANPIIVRGTWAVTAEE